MDQLERAVEYAEYLLETARQKPSQLLEPSTSPGSKIKSIHQKLVDLYIEECNKQPEGKELSHATHLLPKLVKKWRLNCLVLKLYPANEGYSLMLRGKTGIESETVKLPYEISELLEYIDASELPPFLVDLLERAQVNVFYSGCVIVEVRDYRRSTSGSYESQFVLLRPTPQSMLADIHNICNNGYLWTQEDQVLLESKLLLATEEPLCLDPSPAVALVANRLQYERKKFNTPLLKRSVKRFTQAAVNRKRKFAQGPAPKELRLHDFIQRKKDKMKSPSVNLKLGSKSHVDSWKQKPVQLTSPPVDSIDVMKYAKTVEQKLPEDNVPTLVEEHILERDLSQGRKLYAKVTIRQSQTDEFLGEVYLDHDYDEKQQKGVTNRFQLGTRAAVDKYLEQYREIFTEEGNCFVKITTMRPGMPPKVWHTQTSQASNSIIISNAQALVNRQASNLSATITTQGEQVSTSSNVAGKRNMPMQLSLTIGPASGTHNATANLISPQAAATLTGGSVGSSTNQLQLNLQAQQQISSIQPASLRQKTLAHHSTRSCSPSPATTPTSAGGQLPSYTQAVASGVSGQSNVTKAPTPTATPPPIVPQGITISTTRKLVSSEAAPSSQVTHSIQQPTTITAFVPGGDATSGTATLGQQQAGLTNINIANITSIPPNINIQNLAGLQGMNIGLQNMQVSLTGVSGGIAVPVPISMINSSPVQTGILVSSLPSMSSSTVASNTSTTTLTSSTGAQANTTPALVTMVTALPSTTSSAPVSSTAVTSQVVVTAASVVPPSSVINQPTGMLSLPIVAGNLTQFMSAGLKQQATGGLRTQTSLPLLQLQGQQGIQLLNLQQHGNLKTSATLQPASQAQTASKQVTPSSSGIPVTTAVLTAQNLTGQQVTALSQLSIGKQGQPVSGTLTHQQFMQFAAGQQIALQQKQQQQQQLQFQQIQLQKPSSSQSSAIRSKSKKRTTPTPPK